jgi:centromere/kinetochore protein ZW10
MAEAQNDLAEPSEARVQVRFTTRHPDIELPEDTGVLHVSTGLKRYALSTLVNALLDCPKPIPFEFFINGQFLRTSIDDFLTQNGISAESVLNIEYTRALIPPIQVASYEQDDWVSSVDVLSNTSPAGNWSKASLAGGQERILSASYDGLLRIWNLSGEVVAVSKASNNGGRISSLKEAKFLSDKKIVAGGFDGVVRVYKYDEDAATITPTLELYSHKWSVDRIAVHGPSARILSASGDNTISVFAASAKASPAAPENLLPTSTAPSNKRVKLSRNDDYSAPTTTGGALSSLTGHTALASGVIFAPVDPTVAYSTSHDHTLRIWDLPTGTNVDTRTTAHSLLSLVALPKLNLIATGTSARHITLIDPRESAQSVSVMTLRGHTNGAFSLDTDPSSEYGLISGSHDGTCRIWDVRSVKPGTNSAVGEGQVGESVYCLERNTYVEKRRHVIGADGPKVFSVRWDKDVGIVSGGDDNKVQINRAPDTTASS